MQDKEHDEVNKDAYFNYFTEIDAPELNTLPGALPHALKGSADLYVTPSFATLHKRSFLAMRVELKSQELNADDLAQVIACVIAANALFTPIVDQPRLEC
ncbi:hypothetical protein HK098_000948 [Nowakowskiella sp. JEL0407]|nr:hypothetical protein HK098_000948 [Nowakowskiella sp. JEL0407]